jgi:hypothetical protein
MSGLNAKSIKQQGGTKNYSGIVISYSVTELKLQT